MRNLSLAAFTAVLLLCGCKAKDKEPPKKYISVKSLIEKQVAHIDTSFYPIIKLVSTDSLHIDTFHIKRENFREVAKDFLDIPDLGVSKIAAGYKENVSFDTLIRRVIITYTPVEPESEEVQKQQLLISETTDNNGDNKVTSILIEKVKKDRNGLLARNMLWQIDKNFLITTTTQKPGEPEVVTVTRVTWNEDKY